MLLQLLAKLQTVCVIGRIHLWWNPWLLQRVFILKRTQKACPTMSKQKVKQREKKVEQSIGKQKQAKQKTAKGAQSHFFNFFSFKLLVIWYHKKAHIFFMTVVKFYNWNMFRLEDINENLPG